MDKRIPDIERMRKILSLMDQLGLSECSSTYLKDLSGGQRKRLSIAVQVIFGTDNGQNKTVEISI